MTEIQNAPLDASVLAELREITARYPQARSALLPMLHLVQSVDGRVTSRGIETCADILGISAHTSIPRGVTRPSTLCTRCSIGSSADRACGYRAAIR